MAERDLFGHAIEQKREARGRPRHMPTAELRARVMSLHAEGLNQPNIAKAIGISLPTLLLNYPVELDSKSQSGARRAVREGGKYG